jgi:hypothetical protein
MNPKSKISPAPQEAVITVGLTLEMWLMTKRLQKKEKLERDLAKLERDPKRLKILKARILALEAAQAEKASSIGLDLEMWLGTKRKHGKRDVTKLERDAKCLITIKEQVSALEEDMMAQGENMSTMEEL